MIRLDWMRRKVPLGSRALVVSAAVAALALALVAAALASSSASPSPIRVGIAAPLTGIAAAPAADEKAGWLLGIKQLGGAVDGHKIVTYFADTAGDPNQGITATRGLITQRKVDIYVSPIFANVALAIRSYITTLGIPTIAAVGICGAAEIPGYTPAPNIISPGWTCDNPMLPLGSYVYKKLHYTHVTTIGEDYAFGWEQIGAFLSTFKKAGGKVDKELWAPIATSDFAPYVTQIPKDTQAVITLMAGADGPRFLKAYRELGLKGKIPLIGGGTMTDFLDVIPKQDVLGVMTVQNYADGLNTPANRKFVAAFRKATGRTPSYEAESGYAAAVLLVRALKKVKGDVSDRAAVIKALRTTPIVAPRGPVKIDPSTLTPIENDYLRVVREVNGRLSNVPIHTFENVKPWDGLPKAQWEKQYVQYSHSRP